MIAESGWNPLARGCRKFIFLNRAFFMLPLLPFVFATFPTATFKCQSAVRCSARATKLDSLLLRSHQSFPFRHFSRNFIVQCEFSHRPLFVHFAYARARAHSYARVLAVRDNGRGKLHLHRARVRCGYTHMFAVASRDVCPFTYPRVSLFSFFPRATQQQAYLNA